MEPNEKTRELMSGTLTVGQLREQLRDLPDDMPVIVYGEHGQDGESPADSIEQVWYVPESTWGGAVRMIGPDADGDVYEPDGSEVRALWIEPVN